VCLRGILCLHGSDWDFEESSESPKNAHKLLKAIDAHLNCNAAPAALVIYIYINLAESGIADDGLLFKMHCGLCGLLC